MWMASNVKVAAQQTDADEPIEMKDDNGEYPHSANQFMTALLDDFQPVEIGEVDDLSEQSKIIDEVYSGYLHWD